MRVEVSRIRIRGFELGFGVQGFRERATPVLRLNLTMWMSKIGDRRENEPIMTAEEARENKRPAVLQAKTSI